MGEEEDEKIKDSYTYSVLKYKLQKRLREMMNRTGISKRAGTYSRLPFKISILGWTFKLRYNYKW